MPCSRDQAFLLPPDARDGLPADDVAHCAAAAVERVPLGACAVRPVAARRGIVQVAAEWNLIGLAYNCRRLRRLRLA